MKLTEIEIDGKPGFLAEIGSEAFLIEKDDEDRKLGYLYAVHHVRKGAPVMLGAAYFRALEGRGRTVETFCKAFVRAFGSK